MHDPSNTSPSDNIIHGGTQRQAQLELLSNNLGNTRVNQFRRSNTSSVSNNNANNII